MGGIFHENLQVWLHCLFLWPCEVTHDWRFDKLGMWGVSRIRCMGSCSGIPSSSLLYWSVARWSWVLLSCHATWFGLNLEFWLQPPVNRMSGMLTHIWANSITTMTKILEKGQGNPGQNVRTKKLVCWCWGKNNTMAQQEHSESVKNQALVAHGFRAHVKPMGLYTGRKKTRGSHGLIDGWACERNSKVYAMGRKGSEIHCSFCLGIFHKDWLTSSRCKWRHVIISYASWRLWDLNTDDSYPLELSEHNVVETGDQVTCLTFNSQQGVLVIEKKTWTWFLKERAACRNPWW